VRQREIRETSSGEPGGALNAEERKLSKLLQSYSLSKVVIAIVSIELKCS